MKNVCFFTFLIYETESFMWTVCFHVIPYLTRKWFEFINLLWIYLLLIKPFKFMCGYPHFPKRHKRPYIGLHEKLQNLFTIKISVLVSKENMKL